MVLNKEIPVPKDWGMYTPQGNRSMAQMAATLLRRVGKATEPSQVVRAIELYYLCFTRKAKRPTMQEAYDTAVREVVADFADRVSEAAGLGKEISDKLYYKYV